MDSHAPFPFLSPVQTGERGGTVEVRTHRLRPGGLAPTLQGWEAAIEPARPYTDHLVAVLYALGGPPRVTLVWAFDGLAQRGRSRAKGYASGAWPPKGGPGAIAGATSAVALPLGGSPLR